MLKPALLQNGDHGFTALERSGNCTSGVPETALGSKDTGANPAHLQLVK
jgi:hypothetical protein